MNIIDTSNVGPFSYVTFSSDFEIKDEAQIIFAPNGVGKTTLFKILKNQNAGKCDIYTYDINEEPTYNIVDGKKKKMEINPLPTNYAKELNTLEEAKKFLSAKDVLKDLYDTTALAKIKKITNDPISLQVANSGVISFYAPLSGEERDKLKFLLGYPEELKAILLKKCDLKSLTESQKESDLKVLTLLDRKMIYNNYIIENHKDEIKNDGCPLCGRKDDKVYDDILNIRKKILDAKLFFFEDYDFLRHIPNNVSKLDVINEIIDVINNLSQDKYLFLLKTLGSKDQETMLQKELENYSNSEYNIKKYISDRDNAYAKMSLSKKTINEYFPKLYPNSSVAFDDTKKSITVSMPRNMETYSEGEKHDIYSTIRELAIIGSDKDLVIADDPLTDLDTANEYKNVFKFVRLANENGKKVVVFTCNLNFINIANEYHPRLFARYYLTSHYDLTTKSLNMRLMEMDLANKKGAYICLEQIAKESSACLHSQVVSLISERAKLEIANTNKERRDEISKVLHYDRFAKVTINGIEVDNDNLFNAIDSFVSLPIYSSFADLARDRVFYLAALRVYIEKKLYEYQQERINTGFCDCFPPKPSGEQYLTKDKIIAVDNIDDDFPIADKYSKWDKHSLMCLKTMLNDNDHPYSQILPLTYALSIGNDAFVHEIKAIKEIFS